MKNVEWEWSNLPDSSIHSGLDESDRNNFSYHEHHLTITELLNSYNYENFDTDHIESCPGLSSISIQIFQNQYGKNILTPPIKNSDFIIFLKQFLNLFMVLLLMAAGLSVLAWGLEPLPRDNLDLYLGLFLVVIVILNCYSTFKQEMKSEKLMEQFRAMLPASQTVMRYGKSKTIDATDLVNGDCILIRAGDKIPADCRVIKCDQLRIDQSMITGEVEPIEATVDSCNTSHLESRNLLFSGSLVVEGNGMCIVIRIGDRTMLGGMIAMSGDLSKDKGGTLKKEIDDFIWIVVKLALIMATVIFAIGILRDLSIFETLVDGFIVTVIANIPVGLPATITTSLLIVAERMKKQNVFIKRLSSIETLGCCNVILTDKTGTLTENKMTVSHLWCSVDWDNAQLANSYKEMHRFHDLNIQQHTENGKQINKAIYDTFCKVAVLNSSVFLTSKESLGHGANAKSGQFHSPRRASAFLEESGNPTEVAIYRYFKDILKESLRPEDIEEYRTRGVVREWDVPFSSNTKWQMAYHSIIEETNESIAQNTGIITLKGAPDIVLTKCSSYLSDKGGTCSIDDLFYSKVKDMIVHLGHRVSK
jgi:sodium/potassium-transporting ATPase subunit alpha